MTCTVGTAFGWEASKDELSCAFLQQPASTSTNDRCTLTCGSESVTITRNGGSTGDATNAEGVTIDGNGFSVNLNGWHGLLVICGLVLLGLICSALLCYEKVACIFDPILGKKSVQKKKKRAVASQGFLETSTAPAAVAATAATQTPVSTASMPMPVYNAAPTVMQAAPYYQQAPAVSYVHGARLAAPTAPVSYAAPTTYAAPASVAYAAPATAYAGPAAAPYPIAANQY